MTITEWCAVGTFSIAVVILLLQLGRRSAKWDRETANNGNPSLGELARAAKELSRRMDQAGEKTSTLATFVNGMELRMRDIFMDNGRCNDRRQALHDEIQLLRKHGRDGVEL